jgi:hypothetical protein
VESTLRVIGAPPSGQQMMSVKVPPMSTAMRALRGMSSGLSEL